MLRKMTMQDIDQVARIHMTSWSKDDFLTKLGYQYLRKCFYGKLVESNQAFGYVYCKGEKIIGYASGFLDYPLFVRQNLKSILGISFALWQLVTFHLSWKDIHGALRDNWKYRHLKNPKFQFGAIALRNEYKRTSIGKKAITSVFHAVLNEFERNKVPSVWGVTYKNNIPMTKYFEKFGFRQVDEIMFMNRTLVVLEKSF